MGSREGGSLPSVRMGRPSVAINAGHVRGWSLVFLGHGRRTEGKGLLRRGWPTCKRRYAGSVGVAQDLAVARAMDGRGWDMIRPRARGKGWWHVST